MLANGLVASEADTAYLSISGRGRGMGLGGCLFEAGYLSTFSDFKMDANSRKVII